jgi:hypothetical protein
LEGLAGVLRFVDFPAAEPCLAFLGGILDLMVD